MSPIQTKLTSLLGENLFVTELANSGASLLYSTYFGGTGQDKATAIAVDANGDAWVTGNTTSPFRARTQAARKSAPSS